MTIRVVVADDQELVRSGFAMILDAQPDIEVVAEAGDGAAAADAVRRLRPEVALLDIRMPVMDGIEACRMLCAETACRTVMLTTFDSDEYVYEALHAGASGFLLKDVRRDDLVHAVRVVAAGDSLLAPSVARRLIAEYTARPAPPPAGPPAGCPDHPGTRNPAASGPRSVQRGDRGGAGGERAHGEDACRQRAVQAGPARPHPGGDLRVRDGVGLFLFSLSGGSGRFLSSPAQARRNPSGSARSGDPRQGCPIRRMESISGDGPAP